MGGDELVRSITPLTPLGFGFEGKLYMFASELLLVLGGCSFGSTGECFTVERFNGDRGASSASMVSCDEEKCSLIGLCCFAGGLRSPSGSASFRFPLPLGLPPRSVAEDFTAVFIYCGGGWRDVALDVEDEIGPANGVLPQDDDFELRSTYRRTLSPRATRSFRV